MALGSYDSPTFLSQKDKYLMGLSLPELMMGLGVGFVWFLVTLAFPFSTIMRFVVLVPLTVVSMVLMFARITGLSIPMFVLLSLVRSVKKPSYEENREGLLEGPAEWVRAREAQAASRERKARGMFRRRRLSPDGEAKAAELRAEVDKGVTEGAAAAEQWMRDGFKTLVKGQ